MADVNPEVPDEVSQVPWWMRWLSTISGVLGGICCFGGGIAMLVMSVTSITGIIGSLITLILGCLIFVLEATFVCRSVSYAQPVISRMDKIRFWHKGVMYCGLSALAFALLVAHHPMTAIGTLIMPFATGTLYGLMSLGRKADREQMLQRARGGDNYQQFENEPGP